MAPDELPISDLDRDDVVAASLEDYHRRRALGERPMPEDYAERAGGAFQDFLAVLAAEQAIDDVIEPVSAGLFPRPFGDYTLLRELGRGAMGVVYEAMNRRLRRKVALKVMRAGSDDDRSSTERFRREARALAQVKHDHIVGVYEAGDVDGRAFYAMELLEGVSLWDAARAKRLPELRALYAGIADVADALQKLHDAGIVHRDVKPSNIMVRADGRMLLADFGLARTAASEALTRTGEALGTPLYMSPEQVLGKRGGVDGRADVYSLGATLYELVGRRPPCKGADVAATMRMILTERPKPLSELVAKLPPDAERVVMKALEKQPADRYQTAAAMRDDLRAFATGHAVAGRPVSPVEHGLRGLRRFAVPIATVVVAVAAVVAWIATRPAAPARIQVTSHPPADVLVDGVSVGQTPVSREIPPGPHKIALQLAGFNDDAAEMTLEPGQIFEKEVVLVATDCNDPKAVEQMAGDLGVSLESSARPAAAPASSAAPFVALFPRGKVRMEDLDTLYVETGPGFEKGGTIQFLRNGEILGSVPFDGAQAASAQIPFPDAVKRVLATDDKIRWGYVPLRGKPVYTEFHVVLPPVPGTRMKQIAAGGPKGDPSMTRALAARLLCNTGFCTAAFREARALVREKPLSYVAWDTMAEALLREGLDGTAAFREAEAGLASARDARVGRKDRPDAPK